jgi:hypothetical protein
MDEGGGEHPLHMWVRARLSATATPEAGLEGSSTGEDVSLILPQSFAPDFGLVGSVFEQGLVVVGLPPVSLFLGLFLPFAFDVEKEVDDLHFFGVAACKFAIDADAHMEHELGNDVGKLWDFSMRVAVGML